MTEPLDEVSAPAVHEMRALHPAAPPGRMWTRVSSRSSTPSSAAGTSTWLPVGWYEENDALWLSRYAAPEDWLRQHAPIGRGRTHGDGNDLTITAFATGLYISMRVARRLARSGVTSRILDLRWLAPLPVEDILHEEQVTGRVLVVDGRAAPVWSLRGASLASSTEGSRAPSSG